MSFPIRRPNIKPVCVNELLVAFNVEHIIRPTAFCFSITLGYSIDLKISCNCVYLRPTAVQLMGHLLKQQH